MMRCKRNRLYVFFCILLSVFLLAGCTLLPARKTAVPELIEPVSVQTDVLTVKRGTLSVELNGAGVVIPSKTEYVSFQTDGKLSEALVEPGDHVKKGEVLFRLDAGSFDLQLMQQQLIVENMQMALDQSRASGSIIDDIWIHHMNLTIEQLRLEQMLDLQSKRMLVSPSDGIVTFVDDIRPGGTITAYRDVVGIAHTDQLQLLYVGDLTPYLSNIEPGMPAELLHQDAMRAEVAVTPRTAPLEENPQRAELREKTLLFDFVDEGQESGVNIGDSIEFRLELIRKEDVLVIPRGALRNYQGRDFVLVADGETSREVDVQRGMVTQTEVEIIRGLSEGQQIRVTK